MMPSQFDSADRVWVPTIRFTPADRDRTDPRSLAQGFIEATTEWDFAELPGHVQASLIAAAEVFVEFTDPAPQFPSLGR